MSDLEQTIRTRRVSVAARLAARLFRPALDRMDLAFETGGIEASLPDGSYRILGCRAPGPIAIVDLKSWRALVRLGRSGSIGWYQAWEKGEWASPDPVELFDLFMRNRLPLGTTARASGFSRLTKRLRHFWRRNHRKGARRNILAHYDLGNDFYAAWLDETMTYSSALFETPDQRLGEAQANKVGALLNRLKLKNGQSLLEIGSGWGFLARQAAQAGVQVTGLTLSPAQRDWAQHAATALNPMPVFELRDYRDATGQFDAVASVEMVEAVGQRYWPDYFDTIARVLKPGGRAAIQFISIADDVFEQYATSADFIQAFVFPGGMLASESRFKVLAEARGLRWQDQLDFGEDYARTLLLWRQRFDDAVAKGRLPAQFDARFVRLWRYYLMYCEGGFRGGGINVSQVTLVKQ